MEASRRPKHHPDGVDTHRAKHLSLETRQILTDDGAAGVLVNDSESPLAWLARRKGRDGRSMISPHQFIAGEKLRADFIRGNMSPRMTATAARRPAVPAAAPAS
ncbi:hypothetical protein V1282_007177 [Nitrobacteraceae bacterium AZCC 2146]